MAHQITLAKVSGDKIDFITLDARDIKGMARTTTGMCGHLATRVEATRVWTGSGYFKVLSPFNVTDGAWVQALNGEDQTVRSHVDGIAVQVNGNLEDLVRRGEVRISTVARDANGRFARREVEEVGF